MKIREIILEAAYDGMIVAMKKSNPDYAVIIDDQLKWAKVTLKKADRIVWYMKYLRSMIGIDGDFDTAMNDMREFFLHCLGRGIAAIENYQFKDQTPTQVIYLR